MLVLLVLLSVVTWAGTPMRAVTRHYAHTQELAATVTPRGIVGRYPTGFL